MEFSTVFPACSGYVFSTQVEALQELVATKALVFFPVCLTRANCLFVFTIVIFISEYVSSQSQRFYWQFRIFELGRSGFTFSSPAFSGEKMSNNLLVSTLTSFTVFHFVYVAFSVRFMNFAAVSLGFLTVHLAVINVYGLYLFLASYQPRCKIL